MNLDKVIKIVEKAAALGLETIEVDGLKVKFKASNKYPESIVPIPVTTGNNIVGYFNPIMDKNYDDKVQQKLDDDMTFKSVPEKKAEEIIKPMSPFDELSSEEVLFYATPRYDEIQAEKQAHKEKLDGVGSSGG